MLTENLFNEVLVQPIVDFSADTLNIISGYASPTMVERQFNELNSLGYNIQVNLIIGMAGSDGIAKKKHDAFVKATESNNFDCRYIVKRGPVHAKVYIWQKAEKPILAFTGSANYSMAGFGGFQREVLTRCDSYTAKQFYESILEDTRSCRDIEADKEINLIDVSLRRETPELHSVKLSLLDSKTGETHRRAGLNWGQREGRHPDQAYIPIPARIYNTNFFPPVGQKFNVLTDDGEMLTFVRAQQYGKALHTSIDNALMGLYFRARIGVGSGDYVNRQDLESYGRTTVEMFKVDDENYLLDFSVNA